MNIIDIILAKNQIAKNIESIISEEIAKTIGDIETIAEEIEDIESKISNNASSDNKLIDKAYVDNSINNASAFFRGTYATRATLLAIRWQAITENAENYVSNNDFAYVEADETHNNQVWRYCYKYEEGAQDNGWYPQYMINEGPFSQEQWAAINSRIDSIKTIKIESIGNDFSTIKTYSIGDYVFYNGRLYVFKENHEPGIWTFSQVIEITITEELNKIHTTIQNNKPKIINNTLIFEE